MKRELLGFNALNALLKGLVALNYISFSNAQCLEQTYRQTMLSLITIALEHRSQVFFKSKVVDYFHLLKWQKDRQIFSTDSLPNSLYNQGKAVIELITFSGWHEGEAENNSDISCSTYILVSSVLKMQQAGLKVKRSTMTELNSYCS